MKAEGVVVGPAVAIMFRRENIVAGRSSGKIQWNGQARLVILNDRNGSGIGHGPRRLRTDDRRLLTGLTVGLPYETRNDGLKGAWSYVVVPIRKDEVWRQIARSNSSAMHCLLERR
jgi:hypothetical protein